MDKGNLQPTMAFVREIIGKLYKLSERSVARDTVVVAMKDTYLYFHQLHG